MNAVCVIFSLLSPANWGRMPGAAEQARLASGVGGGGGGQSHNMYITPPGGTSATGQRRYRSSNLNRSNPSQINAIHKTQIFGLGLTLKSYGPQVFLGRGHTNRN